MAGLQIWTADGRLRVDTGTAVGLVFGTYSFGGQNTPQSGSLSDGRFSLGTPFFCVLQGTTDTRNQPTISFNGTTLQWSYPNSDGSQAVNRPVITLLYGTH